LSESIPPLSEGSAAPSATQKMKAPSSLTEREVLKGQRNTKPTIQFGEPLPMPVVPLTELALPKRWYAASGVLLGTICAITALTFFAATGPDQTRVVSSNDGNVEIVEAPSETVAELQPSAGAVGPLPPETPAIEKSVVTVGKGGTMMGTLLKAGADRLDAYKAIEALKPHFNPKSIRVGQSIEVGFVTDDQPISQVPTTAVEDSGPPKLASFSFSPDRIRTIGVEWTDQEIYEGKQTEIPLLEKKERAAGIIDSSLYASAANVSVPDPIIAELIRIYSYDIDFQREIQRGDQFDVYFTRYYDEEGKPVKTGELLYGSITTGNKKRALYRFTPDDDKVTDYFDENGKSAKQFLMRTPIEGARMSSGFGKRRHPILGYTKMHKGTDFAARRGTPIKAAGNGVIERASRFGGYGKYIKIRHANGYATAYAHLNGYARGIRKGVRVKQGQTIGYVGSTGRSTGPHLHYEVLRNNKQVNPMRIRIPSGRNLKDGVLEAFENKRRAVDNQLAQLPVAIPVETAELETEKSAIAR